MTVGPASMEDVTAVAQLVLHERRARDRGWWDVMADCLAPDAAIRLSWFRGTGQEFVAASKEMAARGDEAVHFVAAPIVDVVGDRALAEAGATIHLRGDLGGTVVDVTSHARLLYRAERRAGRWVLVALDPVYEYDNLEPSIPGAEVRLDEKVLARARPSYRMLACLLGSSGYPIADDLYGDDRPEFVRRLYRTQFAWLRFDPGSVALQE